MSDKTLRYVAWALCAIFVLVGAVAIVTKVLNRSAGDSIFTLFEYVVNALVVVAFVSVGALLVSKQPRNAIGWLLLSTGLVSLGVVLDFYYASLTSAPAEPSFLFLLGEWLASWVWIMILFPAFFIPLLFPTGRPPSPRWGWLVPLGLALLASFVLAYLFLTEWSSGGTSWAVDNPIGFIPADSFWVMGPFFFGSVFWLGLNLLSLFVRYRNADQNERQQIKWLLYAVGLLAAVWLTSLFAGDLNGLASQVQTFLLFLSILAIPAAIGIAILRYRLFDIDVIIRRTTSYAILTGLLVLVYFGSVVILQRLLAPITGESTVAVILSTLLIAALFLPLRRRIQDAIDKRFFRQKYDAEQVFARFAATARDETDLDALTAELVRVIEETMQPEHVSIWLAPEAPAGFGSAAEEDRTTT